MKSGMMKSGIHKLDLLVDSSEKSSCVWCQTFISCEMATIFTLVQSLAPGLAGFRFKVHLMAIS